MSTEPRRLNVVDPGDVLTGVAPVAFERASKLCAAGDATHRGLVRVAAQIADHAVRRTIAPSGRTALAAGLGTALAWAQHDQDLKSVRRQRADVDGVQSCTWHLNQPQSRSCLDH